MLDDMNLPLGGVRVLDLTTIVFGPYATQLLADFGADVIKIEAPGGDPVRHVGVSRNPGMGALFLSANRNKRSVVLDLKRPAAKEALQRLIGSADMFVHNIRPEKISSLGFGPDDVLKLNPQIIYGGLHGYRENGLYGGRPAYDDVIQGASGVAGLFQQRDGEPQLVPSVIADKNAGLMASNGLVAGYVKRLRTGRGVYMECSMFEGLVSYNLIEHQSGSVFSPPEGEPGYARLLSRNRRPYKTKDGFICALPYTDKHWSSFWKISGMPDMAADVRFSDMSLRSKNIDDLYKISSKVFPTRSTSEWLELLAEADIPVGQVNTLQELKNDPHLTQLGFFRPYEHPTEGTIEIPDTPYQYDRSSLPIRRHQPSLGEHGREVLKEIGMKEAEIQVALGEGES